METPVNDHYNDFSLKTGYVALPCGIVTPVTSSTLELPEVGEDGIPPKQYNFSFTAGKLICPLISVL